MPVHPGASGVEQDRPGSALTDGVLECTTDGGRERDEDRLAAFAKNSQDPKVKELLDRRYERLQSYGRFTDTKADAK